MTKNCHDNGDVKGNGKRRRKGRDKSWDRAQQGAKGNVYALGNFIQQDFFLQQRGLLLTTEQSLFCVHVCAGYTHKKMPVERAAEKSFPW